MMIVPLVDYACNFTVSPGTRRVKGRFPNGRIVFQKHSLYNGTLEAAVFGKSVAISRHIAGLLKFVATVLLGLATTLDRERIQNAKRVGEAVVRQLDLFWVIEFGLIRQLVAEGRRLTILMLFAKDGSFYHGGSARLFVGVLRTLASRDVVVVIIRV
jgi:hypothetical protein